jgi:ribosomal protein L7Ae-like RNA K-turn-binding protein
VVDLAGSAFGRGAWVHPRPDCLRTAAARGLARSLKVPVRTSEETLFEELRASADRRVAALLSAARGAGKLAIGTDAVREALEASRATLIVVATDARAAAASLPASALGHASAWRDKAALGEALGRGDTGVIAIMDPGLARAVQHAIALSTLFPDAPTQSGSSHAFVEVR